MNNKGDYSLKGVKIVYIFLLGYISLLPFYYFPSFFCFGIKLPVVKYFPLFLILLTFVISLLKGNMSIKLIRQEKLNLYILVYFLLTLLSGIGTIYYPISILKSVYYGLTGILVYFIIYCWDFDQVNKLQLLRSMVTLGFIVSLYGIVTLVLGRDILFGKLQYSESHVTDPEFFLKMGRISSSLGNPLFLGSFLSAIFPMSLYLHLYNLEKKVSSWYTATMSIVIFIAITLTFSVGALLGLILFYIFYHIKIKALYKEFSIYKLPKRLFFGGVILLCIVLAIMTTNILLNLYKGDYLFGKFLGRIDFGKIANIHAFIYRLDSIKYAFDFLKTPCYFGMGIGRIGIGDNKFLRITMDNFYCLSLIESGLIPFTFMLITFYLIIKKGYDKFKNATSEEQKRLNIFLIGSVTMFFINMFFWDLFNHPTMRVLFWSFVAFLI